VIRNNLQIGLQVQEEFSLYVSQLCNKKINRCNHDIKRDTMGAIYSRQDKVWPAYQKKLRMYT